MVQPFPGTVPVLWQESVQPWKGLLWLSGLAWWGQSGPVKEPDVSLMWKKHGSGTKGGRELEREKVGLFQTLSSVPFMWSGFCEERWR